MPLCDINFVTDLLLAIRYYFNILRQSTVYWKISNANYVIKNLLFHQAWNHILRKCILVTNRRDFSAPLVKKALQTKLIWKIMTNIFIKKKNINVKCVVKNSLQKWVWKNIFLPFMKEESSNVWNVTRSIIGTQCYTLISKKLISLMQKARFECGICDMTFCL